MVIPYEQRDRLLQPRRYYKPDMSIWTSTGALICQTTHTDVRFCVIRS